MAAAIADGDLASWHGAWWHLAEDLERRADDARAGGHSAVARSLYLRAAEAFRQASFFHRVDLDCAELQQAWPRTAACFAAALDLMDVTHTPLTIPFEDRYLYASLVMPSNGDGPWPTLILPSGYDSCVEEALMMNGLSALQEGYAVLGVDGPGQGKTLYDPATRAFMRADYGPALTAMVDAIIERGEIDERRIAAIGCSFGGYLVPRGAASEPRLAALVADPGQYDIGAALIAKLPEALVACIDDDSEAAVAAFERLAASPEGALLFKPRMAAHGCTTVQGYARVLRDFHNRDAAPRITCPALICDNEIDAISTGQGRQLAEAMTGATVEFVRFTAAEGAGGHCEGTGREIFDERVYPLLAHTLLA